MDIQALLQSHGDDEPSGPDLEYDNDFMELEIAARPAEERQVGDTKVDAEEPDYKDVEEKALAVLGRAHDLRAAIYLTNAGLRLHGLQAMADGTALMRGYLETFWDSCHPQLDEDDDNDPTARVNALRNLADGPTIMKGLRMAPLSESRSFGRISIRDIQVAEGEISAPADMDHVPDTSSIGAAFQDTDPEVLARLHQAAVDSAANVQAIDAIFDENTPGLGPDLDDLKKLLRQIVKRLAAASGTEATVEGGDDEMAADGEPVAAAPAAPAGGPPGAVNSRTDVANAIDRIVAYYEKNEPSSPLPLLLLRAKRLVDADFMTIMRDMAPAGVDNVALIGGVEDE